MKEKKRRSQQKIYTLEAKVLRHLRMSRRLSFRQASKILNISVATVAHIEHGRMNLSKQRLSKMLTAYGYTMEEFIEFMNGRVIPINHRDECIRMLDEIDESKLKAVYSVLCSFVSAP